MNQIAYGFVGLEQLFDQRVAAQPVNIINDAVTYSLQEHNRVLNELLGSLVARTTAAQERWRLPGAGTLQPLDEYGIPLPVRVGEFADISFPIQGAGTAWGTNRVSREMMTVEEANNFQVMVQSQDTDWMARHIVGALFDNTSWIYGDPDLGDLTIQPLANGDSQQYITTNAVMTTADHYLSQNDSIGDANNPFPGIRQALERFPGNGAPYVAYVASNLRADIENLATFLPVGDPQITLGVGNDRLNNPPGGVQSFGEEIVGYVDGVWIVVWSRLPDDYILALAQGASTPALAMREYVPASLQGLFPENHSPDGALEERRFIRYAGFGARNRTAALVMQVDSASYTVPTGYTTPLAV